MAPTLKPERKTAALTAVIEPSLMKLLTAFARKNHVTRGQAVRFIIASFFASDYEKIVVSNEKFVGEADEQR